jgi:hypothetical protein
VKLESIATPGWKRMIGAAEGVATAGKLYEATLEILLSRPVGVY